MKKIAFLIVIIFASCIKTDDELLPEGNKMFILKTDGQEISPTTVIFANNKPIKIEAEANDEIKNIDNGKKFTVTPSIGTVSDNGSFIGSLAGGSVTCIVQDRKFKFFYNPGTEVQNNPKFTISIDGINQEVRFLIKPSEPDIVFLNSSGLSPKFDTNVKLTAVLSKSNGETVSSKLKVGFVAVDYLQNTLALFNPDFSYSNAPDANQVKAYMDFTNADTTTITVKAYYLDDNGVYHYSNPRVIKFKPS